MEVDNSDIDIEFEHAEDSFMILKASADETSPPDDSASEELQSESSDSAFLDIDLDEIGDEEIDTAESIDLDDRQELEEVSSDVYDSGNY
jgi:hypothetical protein